MDENIFVSEAFFENMLLLSVSRKSLQAPSSDDILVGNSEWSNSIFFSGRPNKVKQRF